MIDPGTSGRTAPVLPLVGRGALADQVTRALLVAILERAFPGDRLPTEPDLAVQLGVSRTTVRGALHTLELLGIIGRSPRRGTTLRPHIGRDCITLNRLMGFTGLLASMYDDVRVDQTWEIAGEASDLARLNLDVPADEVMIVNTKTIYADGRPTVLLDSEVPVRHVAPDVVDAVREGRWFGEAQTIFEFSEYFQGRSIDHSVLEIVPEIAPDPPGDRRLLPFEPGRPFLALHEVHYSEDNERVAFTRQVIDDQLMRLKLVRVR